MAKVKIQGNASGTGVLTITAPNTSTDRTITLPDSTGTLATTADVPSSITDNGDATAITIDSSERVGIGTGSPTARLHVYNANDHVRLSAQCAQNTGQHWQFQSRNNGEFWIRNETTGSNKFVMNTTGVVSIPNGIELGSGTDATAANTLDDYEEGTWTPTISGTSSCSIGTIHNSHYTKIGNVVKLYTSFRVDSSASPATGALVFGGFPFAFKTLGEGMFLIGIHYNYRESPMAFVNINGNTYYQNTTVGGNNLGDLTGALDAANQFTMNFSYLTDA